MPSELVQRLAKIQTAETVELEDLSKFSLQELAEMKIDFGNTHRDKTYRQMWLEHQGWVKWFLAHYANSTKENHRKVVHYFSLEIERCELEGRTVPKADQPQGSNRQLPLRPKTQAKSKAYPQPTTSRAAGMPDPVIQDLIEELDPLNETEFDMVSWSQPEADAQEAEDVQTDLTYMANRMDHMENMLNQIVAHLNKPTDQ